MTGMPANTIPDSTWAELCRRATAHQDAVMAARGTTPFTDAEQIARRHQAAEQYRLRNWS